MDQVLSKSKARLRAFAKLLTRTEIAIGAVRIVPVHVDLAVVAIEVHVWNVAIGIPFFARSFQHHRKSFSKFPAFTDSNRIYLRDVISPRPGKQFRKFRQTVITPFQTDQLYQPNLFYNIIC